MSVIDDIKRMEKTRAVSPPSWLLPNVHYLAIVGSESYGAATNLSDRDVQGFCIPPKEDIFPHLRGEIPGFGSQHQRFNVWQEHHCKDPEKSYEYDFSIYSIVRFFQLCMENNPNMLDIISVPTRCIVHITNIGQMVRDNRKMFYHAGSFHKFRGYAFQQMSKLDGGANKSNPKRAADIEKHSYDCKYLMHVVRLALECEQLLTTGELHLDRDSQTYQSIRRGEWTLEQGKKWCESKERDLETLYANSKVLPHSPDEAAIKRLLIEVLESHYGSLDAAIARAPELDMLVRDMDSVLARYRVA